jgi:hypothetical protein
MSVILPRRTRTCGRPNLTLVSNLTIASDGGSITFASATEIFRHWTVALQWELARDWTWDGLTGDAVNVGLVHAGPPVSETVIGQIVVPRIASARAIDPAIAYARDGFTNRDAYRLSVAVPADGPAPLHRTSDAITLRLPVATIPAGIPKLASAGYALSAYAPAADYSSTPARHRQLWLEMTAPPAKGDRLFARVLAYAPDPLLYADPMLRAQQPQKTRRSSSTRSSFASSRRASRARKTASKR